MTIKAQIDPEHDREVVVQRVDRGRWQWSVAVAGQVRSGVQVTRGLAQRAGEQARARMQG